MIDVEGLEAFAVIADQRHFVRAADRLGIAQSVASKRLKRLEEQLGVTLLDRSNRKAISLTRVGELFLPVARDTLERVRRAERIGRNFARGAAGPLRIGYVLSAAMTGLLTTIAARLAQNWPDLELRPVLMETPEQLAALEDGRIDLGLMRPRPSYPTGVSAEPVHREGVQLGLATSHRLADRREVTAVELAGEKFIVPQFQEDVGLIDSIRALARTGGFTLKPIVRTPDYLTAASLTAAGVGVVLAPASLARMQLDGLAFVSVSDYRAGLELMMAFRADLPAPVRDAIRASLPKL